MVTADKTRCHDMDFVRASAMLLGLVLHHRGAHGES